MKSSLKHLLVLSVIYGLRLAQADASFPIANTSNEVFHYLADVPKEYTIFVDIDDTIITPTSKTFRKAPYNKLIDEIKKNKNEYKNYEEIVSNWRLKRKVMLIDPHWPQVLSELKKKHPLYALTKMDTGTFGNINSMEEWRYNELKSLGITFCEETKIPQGSINHASFYKGLFITGPNSKSQTLLLYLQYFDNHGLVMIDDREKHLEDLKQFCEKNSIPFIGILFDGLEKFQDIPNPDVVLLQKRQLIEHAQWLEDDEAETIILEASTAK